MQLALVSLLPTVLSQAWECRNQNQLLGKVFYQTDEHIRVILLESDKWSFVHYSLLIVGGVTFNLVQKTSCQYQVWADTLVMLDILYNWSLATSAFFCLVSVTQRSKKKKKKRTKKIKINKYT